MKDPVFSGKDVAEAVRVASRTLSLPEAGLRYVVLDRGQAGGRGLSATEARIAVLLEKPGQPDRAVAGDDDGPERSRQGRARRQDDAEPAVASSARGSEPADVVRGMLEAWAEAAEGELTVAIQESRDVFEVMIAGSGTGRFLEPSGEALDALEHVIERLIGREVAPRRVRVRCEGYREYRDELLRERALELARQVTSDGVARTTGPLNSYERRVVHVAIEGIEGLETYSVGEGSGRRVTIAACGARATSPSAPESETVTSGAGDEQAGSATSPPETTAVEAPREPEASRAADAPQFDYARFDRPPRGGRAELM
jgi:spoIIIJ-associated protein